MKLEVKQQVQLPLSSCVELVLSGIKYRLFRAGITVVIIALAVAFLMTMLSESLMSVRMSEAVAKQTADRRLLLFWVGRLTTPLTGDVLAEQVAGLDPSSDRAREFAAWGEISPEDLKSLIEVAGRQTFYLAYLDELNEAELRNVLGRSRGLAAFRRLQDAKALEQFEKELPHVTTPLPALPEGLAQGHSGSAMDQFREFLTDFEKTQPLRDRIRAGHAERIAKIESLLGRDATRTLASADETFRKRLEELDFHITPEQLQAVRHEAELRRDAELILSAMRIGKFKRLLASRTAVSQGDVTEMTLLDEIDSESGANWYLDQLRDIQDGELADLAESIGEAKQAAEAARSQLAERKKSEAALPQYTGDEAESIRKKLKELPGKTELEATITAKTTEAADLTAKLARRREEIAQAEADGNTPLLLSAERIVEVIDSRKDEIDLAELESVVGQSTGGKGFLGFSGRATWLLIVSLLVCTVGIANAMLMSVTERFREIATMKCLGATDRLIMISFVMESVMQGLAGGVIGALAGFVLGLVRGLARYGWLAASEMPWGPIGIVAGGSLLVGMVLSALAAMYPARIAARLAPMEAMRIE